MSTEDVAKQFVIKAIAQGDREAIVELGNLLDTMRALLNAHSRTIKQLVNENKELKAELNKLDSKLVASEAKKAVNKLFSI